MSAARRGTRDPLNKRIPENPRYKHVKSVVDSGASVTRYLEHLEEIRKNYRYKKDEIFRRIKVTVFAQLVLQVASVEAEEDQMTPVPSEESALPHHCTPSPMRSIPSPPDTARSTLSDLVTGMGEMDICRPDLSPSHSYLSPSQTPSPSYQTSPVRGSTSSASLPHDCPYLLLDVRDAEEYERCHIISAKSYPAHMLSRSCNYFTREIYQYKNKSGCIIVLYDEDERIAPDVATKLVQRDVDNVFILSGGLRILYKVFPEGLMTGRVPVSCLPTPPSSVAGKRKPSNSKKPLPVTLPAREWFHEQDLIVVQKKLDEVLLSGGTSSRGSTASSRMTSRTTDSRASSMNTWKY